MGQPKWYYLVDGRADGPLPEARILELLARGVFGPSTPLRREDSSQWTPADQAGLILPGGNPGDSPPGSTPAAQGTSSKGEGLRGAIPVPVPEPPCVRDTPVMRPVTTQRSPQEPVRPFVRFFARQTDLALFTVAALGGDLLLGYPLARADPRLLGVVFLPAWALVETALLCVVGTTPGKWLLRTSVRKVDGSRLSFADALRRSLGVWFWGLGLGIPFVSLVAAIYAFGRLKRVGCAAWDENLPSVVRHGQVGIRQAIEVVALVTACTYLAVLLAQAQHWYVAPGG